MYQRPTELRQATDGCYLLPRRPHVHPNSEQAARRSGMKRAIHRFGGLGLRLSRQPVAKRLSKW